MNDPQDEVLNFWFRELTPQDWFKGGEALDALVRGRFADLHRQAGAGMLDDWAATPLGRLGLILLLDQFSRHIHRDTAAAFETDVRAQQLAVEGMAMGMDEKLAFGQRQFFYMPLMHAEDPQLQAMSIERFTALRDFAQDVLQFAQGHKGEIDRFGRFPHRNEALARTSSEGERAFIDG
ncbi:membrane protein [Novosphingobium barchaimii LL02]|uniref:Membrane protein n=1 Tax=Novosphingobium barchaimii LL02 TaxID=1114963 RepID=A0A0J7Y824_9SPHN|nr:DUF924 family protein [Novosphingobium barchaimii]KMS59792.1 membrane protein [Novosphingobium barchaimii LL02]